MLNPDTKEVIQAIDRERAATVPLIVGVQNTFKSAADLDDSASPIDQGLIDELGSTDSDGPATPQ
jgi:hypothetical protein